MLLAVWTPCSLAPACTQLHVLMCVGDIGQPWASFQRTSSTLLFCPYCCFDFWGRVSLLAWNLPGRLCSGGLVWALDSNSKLHTLLIVLCCLTAHKIYPSNENSCAEERKEAISGTGQKSKDCFRQWPWGQKSILSTGSDTKEICLNSYAWKVGWDYRRFWKIYDIIQCQRETLTYKLWHQ